MIRDEIIRDEVSRAVAAVRLATTSTWGGRALSLLLLACIARERSIRGAAASILHLPATPFARE